MTYTLGYFGQFGGSFVPETLHGTLNNLRGAYSAVKNDSGFWKEFNDLLINYGGRPTPLTAADNLTKQLGGARIWLKREDLNHTGSHKLNNCLGQILLAKRMGKKRIIAETGAGQHGVATATVCALFGLPCVVYMGEEDTRRQALNVFRMELLGAEVRPVKAGSRTLKEAVSAAIRDWMEDPENTYYLIGSCVGPSPYPEIVRDFQSVIGKETRAQILDKTGKLPDTIVACVGGGSNAIGMFHPFIDDLTVKLNGVEAGGRSNKLGEHGASLNYGRPGILHGALSYLLQTDDGQIALTHSISAGLDYPSVGPEHSHLKDTARAQYVTATDTEALTAFQRLAQTEGIIPALESAHAVAHAIKFAPTMNHNEQLIICLSGRGDKDVAEVKNLLAE